MSQPESNVNIQRVLGHKCQDNASRAFKDLGHDGLKACQQKLRVYLDKHGAQQSVDMLANTLPSETGPSIQTFAQNIMIVNFNYAMGEDDESPFKKKITNNKANRNSCFKQFQIVLRNMIEPKVIAEHAGSYSTASVIAKQSSKTNPTAFPAPVKSVDSDRIPRKPVNSISKKSPSSTDTPTKKVLKKPVLILSTPKKVKGSSLSSSTRPKKQKISLPHQTNEKTKKRLDLHQLMPMPPIKTEDTIKTEDNSNDGKKSEDDSKQICNEVEIVSNPDDREEEENAGSDEDEEYVDNDLPSESDDDDNLPSEDMSADDEDKDDDEGTSEDEDNEKNSEGEDDEVSGDDVSEEELGDELEDDAEMADETETPNKPKEKEEEELIDDDLMVVEASKDDINGLVVCDAKKGGIVGVFLTPSEGELISEVVYDKANLPDEIKDKDRKAHLRKLMKIKWYRTPEKDKSSQQPYYFQEKNKSTYTDRNLYKTLSKLSGFFLINTHDVKSLSLNSLTGRNNYENNILAKVLPNVKVTWKKVTINKTSA